MSTPNDDPPAANVTGMPFSAAATTPPVPMSATFSALDQVADYNTAFMNLDSGVDDAVAVDIGVANYQIASRNG